MWGKPQGEIGETNGRARWEKSRRKKGTILIIDDDPLTIQFLLEFLEMEGYTLVSATGVENGWKEYKRVKPDLVLVASGASPDAQIMLGLGPDTTLTPCQTRCYVRMCAPSQNENDEDDILSLYLSAMESNQK